LTTNSTGDEPELSTGDELDELHTTKHEPWESWGTTARYVIVRLAQTMPTALLVWQAFVHH
jgi:hypothetical protein